MLNVTDFALWNIVTSISENIDTGSHNYYLTGPTIGTEPSSGRLWRAINVVSISFALRVITLCIDLFCWTCYVADVMLMLTLSQRS